MKNEVIIEVQKSIGIRELFMQTLKKIGCQYELGKDDDDRIYFAYQGEHFIVNAQNGNNYVGVWDTFWWHAELYDVEELSRLRRAINGANLNTSVTTVYTIDEAGSNVDVHCKATILFIQQIPELEDYLRLELNEFFRAHHFVESELEKLREKDNKDK